MPEEPALARAAGPINAPPAQVSVDSDLVLVPLFEIDAAILYRCIESSRGDLTLYLRNWDFDLAESQAHLEKLRREWGTTDELTYGIVERGVFVGAIKLARLEARNRAVEIGYWLALEAQGRGLITRAVRAALELLFEHFDANQVIINSYASNAKSRAVAERLGFRLDGITRQWRVNQRGELCDKVTYSLLRDEWRAQHNST